MKMRLVLSTLLALTVASAAYAQETLKGEIATVDEARARSVSN
jgi:ABC-type arginine/histidine transport system permease subunit